jgi:SAM-dependent methyltransferase
MPLTLPDLDFLTSAAGQALLHRLTSEDLRDSNTLKLLTQLRKEYTAEEAGAALEMARLRVKAVEKFGENAPRMWFVRHALEQASDRRIREYRASGVSGTVVDVCCGIGSDALQFAQNGATVTGVDIDPVRIAIARLNAETLGLNITFELADAREITPTDVDLLFFDPARRADDKRIYDVEQYIPPLSLVKGWKAREMMVKLSPGVDLAQLESYGGEVEFISVEGDLKEAVLHLRAGLKSTPTATLITAEHVLHWRHEGEPESRPLSQPLGWLIEPDPAIIRAGLVEDAAVAFDGYQLDETIAYFTTDSHPLSEWVRAWRVLDWMPFNIKKLRAHLRETNVGRVTVKKRGSPLTPEQLIAQLKLKGGEEVRTLVLTRYQGDPIVIVCEEHPL